MVSGAIVRLLWLGRLGTDHDGASGKHLAEIPPTAAHHVSIAFPQGEAKA